MGKPVEPSEPEEAEDFEPGEAGEISSVENREAQEEEYEEDETETGWLEIRLVDMADEPVPGERFKLRLENGMVFNGTLDPEGVARIEYIPEGTHTLIFPRYDQEAIEEA
ncbi:MAG: hypothetical protein ABFS86_18895 [Planctomycetota bacterium]